LRADGGVERVEKLESLDVEAAAGVILGFAHKQLRAGSQGKGGEGDRRGRRKAKRVVAVWRGQEGACGGRIRKGN
jgi:hypothetical protein